MLYDILFIDDDFGKLPDPEATWENNAQKLFQEFIRENLRVTYTTGELDDIRKLSSKDLSCIKYIFCDLHLTSLTGSEIYLDKLKVIRSKLIGVFQKLTPFIKSTEVTVFINSKYTNEWHSIEQGLKEALQGYSRYTFELIERKNKLSEKQMKELLQENLDLYAKSLIINKAIELEKVFDKKLDIEKFADIITFENKHKKLRELYDNSSLGGDVKKSITLLQQIRNKLAHTDNNLTDISGDDLKKKFWKICSGQEKTDDIKFIDFKQLAKYVDSIDTLIGTLRQAENKA